MPRETNPRDLGQLSHIQEVSRLGTWPHALTHLEKELARLGLSRNSLKGYQARVFSEIKHAAPEENFAELYEWWRYDIKRLIERGQEHGRPFKAAKPRIDVSILMTTRGNLTATWEPTGAINDEAGPDSDWIDWRLIKGVATRPSNELLFVRELEYPYSGFARDTRRRIASALPEQFQTPELKWHMKWEQQKYRREYRAIDGTLLTAAAELVEMIKTRLAVHFDVRMRSDIFTEWDKDKRKGADTFDYRLRKWEIEDTAEHTARLEREELKRLAKETGLSAEKLVKALNEVGVKKRTGPAPTVATQEDRLTKDLKKAGHKITPSVTRRYLELLKRHRPELFPRSPYGPSSVVPFKPRDRSN